MQGYGAIFFEDGVMKRGPMVSEQLVKDDLGMWTVTLGPIKPDSYGYNYIIDGVRVIDPNNVLVKKGWSKSFERYIDSGKRIETL